jgi:hypothetical protein
MANRKNTKKNSSKDDENTQYSKPKFPYTTVPGALRKFLGEVPKKPKPLKVDSKLLKAWGHLNNNALSIIPVIKAAGLLDAGGTPTAIYEKYMSANVGPGILAQQIKDLYSSLFQTSHEPYKENQATLKNFFNIHSGGGERTIEYQIQTFKVLCEFADFTFKDGVISGVETPPISGAKTITNQINTEPGVHINIHIHFPENKSRADYEEIIKDLGKYIFGR